MGRHSRYTKGIGDEICAWIAEGRSLSSWARKKKISLATVYKWLRANQEFVDNYVRAREDAADTLFDELMEIAETEEDVNRARLKIDTRKWVAARMKPKSYGDKQTHELTGADGKDLQFNINLVKRGD